MRMVLENILLWKVSRNKRNENLEKVKNKNHKFFISSQRYQLRKKTNFKIKLKEEMYSSFKKQ